MVFNLSRRVAVHKKKIKHLGGQEILAVESKDFCCETYRGNVSLHHDLKYEFVHKPFPLQCALHVAQFYRNN